MGSIFVSEEHQLLPFQQEDVDKLRLYKSCLIGNDPGTGKTYEGIALDLTRRKSLEGVQKTLIICPKSVISVWDSHCMELTDLDVYVVDAKKRNILARQALDPKCGGYFIVHWDALRTMPELKKVQWLHVIADEVHRAKNRKAQTTRALWQLKTTFKTGMSGTPADDKAQDLWAIIHWLWPRYYTSFWNFVKAYMKMEVDEEKGYRKIVGPNPETIGALQKEMEPWFVRRRKEDVLPDLPDKYYTRMWVDLDSKQRKAYNEMRKTMSAWVEEQGDLIETNPIIANAAVAQLVRLQQFADAYVVPRRDENGAHMWVWRFKKIHSKEYRERIKHLWTTDPFPGTIEWAEVEQHKRYLYDMIDPSSKISTLIDILEDRGDEQIVVFSTFKTAINLLAERLGKEQVSCGVLTGDTSDADRARVVSDFQAGNIRVFAGTIAAGGVGLTLTAARTVVFLDRVWSPSINKQAEDRLHRIGQKDAVEVIDLMARNTVDLGKAAVLSKKLRWLQMLLGDTVDPEVLIAHLEQEEKDNGN